MNLKSGQVKYVFRVSVHSNLKRKSSYVYQTRYGGSHWPYRASLFWTNWYIQKQVLQLLYDTVTVVWILKCTFLTCCIAGGEFHYN